nr:NADH dehydrogenase subunit 3 [Asiopsocus sonorensis]
MLNIYLMILSIFMLSTLFMLLPIILAMKKYTNREKSSPFECGFEQKSSCRWPFSLKFFIITIVFLVFDVEVVLFIPAIYILKKNSIMMWSIIFFMFSLILILGLIYEWKQNMLEWMY